MIPREFMVVGVGTVLGDADKVKTPWEAYLLAKKKGLNLPCCKEWDPMPDTVEKEYPNLFNKLHATNEVDVMEEIIAHPNPETGKYSPRIIPEEKAEKGEIALLIRNAEKTEEKEIIGGERIRLETYPEMIGYIKKPVPELGLKAGDDFIIDLNYEWDQGLRAVLRQWGWTDRFRGFVDASFGTLWRPYTDPYLYARFVVRKVT